MKATVKWREGETFVGSNERNQQVVMSGAGEHPSPMELVLMSLGACSSIDVVSILEKARQDLTDCVCDVDAERADSVPKVFTRIHCHYRVTGRNLGEKQVQRAVQLSVEKYCSVLLMLQASVTITSSYEIVESGAAEPSA